MPGADVAMISAIDAIGKEQRAAAKPSGLENKKAGIIITGDSDGAQSIIASLANFFNAVGLELPPFATLSVLWEAQAKGKDTPREKLLEKYEKDYASTADKMISQLVG
jgi:hypothetical protein